MRTFVLVAVATTCWLGPASAQERDDTSKQSATDAVFKELAASLPKDGQRANAARLELEYWHKHQIWGILNAPVQKPVKTKDGKAAEIVFLTAPAMSVPGTDFSMAFLLVEKRVVDWVSCWTHNRTANQELLLEDVDGDGSSDVAFRANDGWWGLLDKRKHSRPGDKRKWLYAYAITAKGFQSFFPNTERNLKVKLSYDTADQPIRLQVKGLPESLRERQMVKCTLSATNSSDKGIAIKPAGWFSLEIDNAGHLMTYGPRDKRPILKPGETISEEIRLVVEGAEKEVTMHWTFMPGR